MKTIKQIADEIGVSKQAIQKRIAREPLNSYIHPYVSTEGTTKYISEAGEALIIGAFSKRVYTPSTVDETETGIDESKYVDTLIAMLQKELDAKNTQIVSLTEANRELTAALENTTASLAAAHALHAGTMKHHLADGEIDPEQPSGFWARLFGRRPSW